MFVASKLFWSLAQPSTLLLLLLLLGIVLFLATGRRRGFGLVAGVSLVYLLVVILPVPDWALMPLETRFRQPEPLPARVDGIILLGGGLDALKSARHDTLALTESGARIIAALELARRYPMARVVVSGGPDPITGEGPPEAALTARFFESSGIAAERLVVEGRSRNTAENAEMSRALAKPAPGETWLLVTSAFHMPRSVGCFRAVDWPVVAYPVDYRAGDAVGPDRFELARRLGELDLAMKEWTGLVAYRLLGRTDVLFPSP